MKYGLFGNLIAKDGKHNELLEILLRASILLKQNEDCLHYTVSTSSNPKSIWVYEIWTNKKAHEESLTPEDIQTLIQEAMPLIEEMGNQTELSVHGGIGL